MAKHAAVPRQYAQFLARYERPIQACAKRAVSHLNERLPGAARLIYDNYNALVIAFSPTERTADCVLSIALYPRWVTLFFAKGGRLPDPENLLRGSGKTYRHIVLANADDLERPAVRRLIAHAVDPHPSMSDPTTPGPMIIKLVSAKQRPRRPEPARQARG
jgi:hypothetical protein